MNYDISLARRTDKNELVTIPDADILFIFEQDELGFSVGWCGTPDPFWPWGGVLAARLVELLEKFRVWILPIKIIKIIHMKWISRLLWKLRHAIKVVFLTIFTTKQYLSYVSFWLLPLGTLWPHRIVPDLNLFWGKAWQMRFVEPLSGEGRAQLVGPQPLAFSQHPWKFEWNSGMKCHIVKSVSKLAWIGQGIGTLSLF